MDRERHTLRPVLGLAALLILLAGSLVVQAAPPAQAPQQVAFDQDVTGRITENTTEQAWTFTGHAGDVILIDMRASGGSTLDTLLTLLDPAKNTLTTDDDGGEGLNSRIGPYRLSEDGTYTILAASYNGSGSYTLGLKNLNTIPTLRAGKPLVGAVNADHTADYFRLELPHNAALPLIRLEVTDDNPAMNPYLSVYGSAGFIVGTEQNGAPVLDPVALVTDGMVVAVVSWNPESAGSRYQIVMSDSEVDLLQDGISQTGRLDYRTLTQQHYFIAEEGDTIEVTVSTRSNIAPALEIYPVDFSTILLSTQGDAVNRLMARVEVPFSSIYAIAVTDGSLLGDTGSYTIQLNWVED